MVNCEQHGFVQLEQTEREIHSMVINNDQNNDVTSYIEKFHGFPRNLLRLRAVLIKLERDGETSVNIMQEAFSKK